ncbi:MAG: hypothetical protein KGV57_02210 [Fusobacterium sp.]|nr:hypothetical protein [Fusobacterium sp.]
MNREIEIHNKKIIEKVKTFYKEDRNKKNDKENLILKEENNKIYLYRESNGEKISLDKDAINFDGEFIIIPDNDYKFIGTLQKNKLIGKQVIYFKEAVVKSFEITKEGAIIVPTEEVMNLNNFKVKKNNEKIGQER